MKSKCKYWDRLEGFCRWSVRGIKIRFSSHYAEAERVASRSDASTTESGTGRRAFAFHSYRLTLNMDSDEEMQQFDSEPPPFPSAAKGKGKAVLGDEPEEPASGRDDTLPWYVKFLSRSK